MIMIIATLIGEPWNLPVSEKQSILSDLITQNYILVNTLLKLCPNTKTQKKRYLQKFKNGRRSLSPEFSQQQK